MVSIFFKFFTINFIKYVPFSGAKLLYEFLCPSLGQPLRYSHTHGGNRWFFLFTMHVRGCGPGSSLNEICTVMVLILDGILEIGAQARSNLCYLISLRHLIRSTAVTNRIFSQKKHYSPLCVRNMF